MSTTSTTTSSLSHRPLSIPSIHLPRRRHSLVDDSVTTVTPSVHTSQLQPTEYQVVAESCDWCIPMQWGGGDEEDDDEDSITPSSKDESQQKLEIAENTQQRQERNEQANKNNRSPKRFLSRKKMCTSSTDK